MKYFFQISLIVSLVKFVLAADNYIEIRGSVTTTMGQNLTDYFNFAGLDSNANDGYDIFTDLPEPPHCPFNYLSLCFPHAEWGSIFGENFSADFRNGNDNLINQVKIYPIQAGSDQIGRSINLEFNIGEDYPQEYGIVFCDSSGNPYQNIREDNDFDFVTVSEEVYFELRLGDGTAPEIEILFPTPDTVLYQNNNYNIIWESLDITPIKYSVVLFSLDNGLNWTLLDTLEGCYNSLQWAPPDITSDSVKIKIEAEDWAGNIGVGISESTFSIAFPASPLIIIDVSGNDIILHWQNLTSVSGYRVYYQNVPYFTPGGIPQAVVLPPDTSWIDAGAVGQGQRFYRVVVEY